MLVFSKSCCLPDASVTAVTKCEPEGEPGEAAAAEYMEEVVAAPEAGEPGEGEEARGVSLPGVSRLGSMLPSWHSSTC